MSGGAGKFRFKPLRVAVLLILVGVGLAPIIAQKIERSLEPPPHVSPYTPPSDTMDLAAENRRLRQVEALRLAEVKSNVKLRDFSWAKGGFGTVGLVNFTVSNDNDFSIRDLIISCVFDGPSGTSLSAAVETVYDVVPAKGRKRFKDFNVGRIHSQSAKASCELKDWTR